jgi:hypothetical protein
LSVLGDATIQNIWLEVTKIKVSIHYLFLGNTLLHLILFHIFFSA